jgi:hypothetical protein
LFNIIAMAHISGGSALANQTRVVLDETERPKAEQILEQTGIKTFSQLFSVFIVNYGDHLVNALKASPALHLHQ